MELWDIYDMDRNKTGKTMVRGSEYEPGDYHLVIHICIFNKEGKLLIQRRQPFKEDWSDLWDITVGGSAVTGDSSQAAAERELFEELGIKMDFRGIRPNLTINFEHGFDDFYLVEKEVCLEDLSLQYEEVQDAKWATEEEILQMIENEKFIPYYPSFIKLLFDLRKQYGCRSREE